MAVDLAQAFGARSMKHGVTRLLDVAVTGVAQLALLSVDDHRAQHQDEQRVAAGEPQPRERIGGHETDRDSYNSGCDGKG